MHIYFSRQILGTRLIPFQWPCPKFWSSEMPHGQKRTITRPAAVLLGDIDLQSNAVKTSGHHYHCNCLSDSTCIVLGLDFDYVNCNHPSGLQTNSVCKHSKCNTFKHFFYWLINHGKLILKYCETWNTSTRRNSSCWLKLGGEFKLLLRKRILLVRLKGFSGKSKWWELVDWCAVSFCERTLVWEYR